MIMPGRTFPCSAPCALRSAFPPAPLEVSVWYVIQTKPKKEKEANSYLSIKGLEVYSPLLETYFPNNGEIKRTCKPLFPGYIFANFDYVADYGLVKWGRGIKKIVGFSDNLPSPVSEEVVNEIKSRCGEDGFVRINRCYRPNEQVRVKSGPFKDLMGIFETWVPEKERVRILLNLIGFQPQVELHVSMIERVN